LTSAELKKKFSVVEQNPGDELNPDEELEPGDEGE
jgi:hypothetical protein